MSPPPLLSLRVAASLPDHKQMWISVRAPRHVRMSIVRICTSHIGACRPALGMQACRGTVQRVPEYTPTDARALQLPPVSRLSFRVPTVGLSRGLRCSST